MGESPFVLYLLLHVVCGKKEEIKAPHWPLSRSVHRIRRLKLVRDWDSLIGNSKPSIGFGLRVKLGLRLRGNSGGHRQYVARNLYIKIQGIACTSSVAL